MKINLEPLNFEEAIDFFKGKVPLSLDEFAELANEVKTRAFTVAGAATLDIIKDILDELTIALEKGLTMEEFQKSVTEKLKGRWDGMTPYRIDNIFRTNLLTAYAVGRYKQLTDPDVVDNRPYWQYDAVLDSRTRPTHRALDGQVRRYDDPFWDTWYPPNGFRCRCGVISVSERQLKRKGLTIETGKPPGIIEPKDEKGNKLPAVPLNPDPGFDFNPGKAAWQPDLSKYPDELRKAYERRNKVK